MTHASPDPDHELIRACQDPNDDRFEAAFEKLYSRYRDRVYSIAYRMLGTTGDAMDVVQEAFAILFRKIGTFRFDAKFSTWLFRLVVNCCVDHKRREASRMPDRRSSVEGLADEPDSTIDPVEAAEVTELGHHVHSGLQHLSPKLRAVLVLRYLEGLSYEELSHSLEVSLGTVKSRLARAHVAFEQVMRGTLDSFDYPIDVLGRRMRPNDGKEGVA